ncbi:PTS sugar transporter subunit IIA [Thermoanaerobacterium butyriciformans]|uniref:Mannitol-specific phosphotransferase enzyme IIA component n=1 Tax=Thermoanaerobacterium butyriciformans TaxID=1702242 RepID=A0ABS4NCQ7_9THEO|nr:PTS sugar transporter subunit IIA [Thermoanaerobacterium butyriciformans]MBP2071431.1 PTS system mannitol-specific IIA component [Thermoanaerobacterium butyriciformans]
MNSEILNENNIVLNEASEPKFDAIKRAGRLLVDRGYVEKEYIEGMIERENDVTTYIGNGIAIPHGVSQYVKYIKKSGIVVIQYPDGVDFGDGNMAYVVIGIAGKDDEHLEILSSIALTCQYEENVRRLRDAKSPQEIIQILKEGGE